VASLLALYAYRQFRSSWDDRVVFLLLTLLAVGIGAAGFVVQPLGPVSIPLAFIGVVTLSAALYCKRLIGSGLMLPAAAAFMLVITTALFLLLPQQLATLKYYRKVVMEMNRIDPGRQVPVVEYREFLPSVSFYRQKLAIIAHGRDREVGFEEDSSYRQWFIEKDDELKAALAGMERVFLVAEEKNLARFEELTSFVCCELQSQRKVVGYDCRHDPVEQMAGMPR
jgi:4-amino-4-deoxy-L-arabinose transferase